MAVLIVDMIVYILRFSLQEPLEGDSIYTITTAIYSIKRALYTILDLVLKMCIWRKLTLECLAATIHRRPCIPRSFPQNSPTFRGALLQKSPISVRLFCKNQADFRVLGGNDE